jgi:hypothetical protein
MRTTNPTKPSLDVWIYGSPVLSAKSPTVLTSRLEQAYLERLPTDRSERQTSPHGRLYIALNELSTSLAWLIKRTNPVEVVLVSSDPRGNILSLWERNPDCDLRSRFSFRSEWWMSLGRYHEKDILSKAKHQRVSSRDSSFAVCAYQHCRAW